MLGLRKPSLPKDNIDLSFLDEDLDTLDEVSETYNAYNKFKAILEEDEIEEVKEEVIEDTVKEKEESIELPVKRPSAVKVKLTKKPDLKKKVFNKRPEGFVKKTSSSRLTSKENLSLANNHRNNTSDFAFFDRLNKAMANSSSKRK